MVRAGLQWVFLITGTTIGAGYTSGREIWQFFGEGSELAILLFTVLFILSINKVLMISYETQSTDYLPVLKKITGPKLAVIYDYMILIYLFCVTIVMIAGSGATFQSFNFPAWWGTSIICLALAVIFRKGIQELLLINQILMPILIISLIIILFIFMKDEGIPLIPGTESQKNWAAAFPFTALNILPLIAVLGAIGKKIQSKSEIYFASIISGLILGGISFIYNRSLIYLSEAMVLGEIPLFAIINNYHFNVMIFMSVMLWLAIYTTAGATLLGLVTRIRARVDQPVGRLVFIILLCMLPLSGIGFSQLIAIIYPLYGMLNLYLLVKLISPYKWNKM